MRVQPDASHFINGEYVEDKNGKMIECVFPATGEVVARLYSATPSILEQALISAQAAQKSWAKLSGTERGRVLRKAADIMRERNRALSELETYDTGKPMQETLCALKVAEILIEAGAPAGIFNVVQGYSDVGTALVTDSRADKVSLTGFAATGKKVYAAAAAGMKHVTMELDGKSPLIIFDDADLEDAVGGAMLGNFYSTGQVCSNGTRVFVQKGIKDAFLKRFAQRDLVMRFVEKGKAEGTTLICGGHIVEGHGYFIEPTVSSNVTDDMTIAREEIFGPVMPVLEFSTEDEVIYCANDTPVEGPFGEVKGSGVGRENSKAAIEHYSQLKTIYVKMSPVNSPY